MGKRSKFERNDRDFYPTPYEAAFPLIAHLPDKVDFIEPCAGDGRLIRHLEKHGHVCTHAFDLEPMAEGIIQKDILFFSETLPQASMIITNPPWEREYLHKMIDKFRLSATRWLLFDADWMHTTQANPYLKYCSMIVSIGRIKWIEGTNNTGMDNCCWYRFENSAVETKFIGR